MLKELYQSIKEDAHAQIVQVEGRQYSTKPLNRVYEPEVECIKVSTLTGFVDYLKKNVDKLGLEKLICHVESPTNVVLLSNIIGQFRQRECYIRAVLDQLQHKFNTYLDGERFNIMLQSLFVDYPDNELKATDRALVIKYASHTKQIAEGVTLDDGVTQAVTVKAGLASVETVIMPNPVTLRPYRTFTEVEQPASSFVFRAKEGPEFMLVEADGGAWKSEAMKNIKNYLEFEVPELNVIA